MIVAFQPGGTIRDVRVVLKPDELIPNRFNTPEAEIFREDETGTWLLIKPRGSVLSADSILLSKPEVAETAILDLTKPLNGDTVFEHPDIISVDDEETKP